MGFNRLSSKKVSYRNNSEDIEFLLDEHGDDFDIENPKLKERGNIWKYIGAVFVAIISFVIILLGLYKLKDSKFGAQIKESIFVTTTPDPLMLYGLDFLYDINMRLNITPELANLQFSSLNISKCNTIIDSDYDYPIFYDFEQRIDHFSDSNKVKFKQRYLHIDRFYQPYGPIFVILGGEWTPTIIEKEAPFVLEAAKRFNATVFYLEHRYYGESLPFDNFNEESLKYLTTQQALKDLKVFIRRMKPKYPGAKVILFGCSYPGMLVAWSRATQHHLSDGGVAFSAPIIPGLYYREKHFHHMRQVIRATYPECWSIVLNTIDHIKQFILTPEGRKQLNLEMNFCSPGLNASHLNITLIYQLIIDLLWVNIWNDYQFKSGPNCKKWDNTLTVLNGNNCSELCMELSEKSIYYGGDVSRNMKAWIWQQCTEIGDIDVIDMCTIQFGPKYNETFARNALNDLKQRYGTEKTFKATNLILTYGTYDLWSTSGYYETSNPTVYQIKVEGGLHCRVIGQSNNTKIQEAQEKIMNILEGWLKK